MIYLDHHAASPPTRAALDAATGALHDGWANPSSAHSAGQTARHIVERARQAVAHRLEAAPADIVLTSGGTEACNLAIHALTRSCARVVTTAVEHPAVAEAVRMGCVARRSVDVITLPVPSGVPPSASALEPYLTADTLVAVQHVNHETGTVFPVADYGAICRARGAPLFVDASQGLGKVPVDVKAWDAAAVAVSATKVGGVSGAGALFVDRSVALEGLLVGGGQERGRRAGSPSVSAMAAFAAALENLDERLDSMTKVMEFRQKLELALAGIGGVINGEYSAREDGLARVATVANVYFDGLRGDILVAALDVEGICVSSGAACSSGLGEPSPVIAAMYPDDPARARGAVRFSFGPDTPGDIDVGDVARRVTRVVGRARAAGGPSGNP